MVNSKIIGTGSYLPSKILTNFDLEKIVDTSDDWIVERTGIKERRIADKSELTSDLALKASLNAIKNANIDKNFPSSNFFILFTSYYQSYYTIL